MGCVSSKLAAAELRQEKELLRGATPATVVTCGGGGGDCPNHIVSLTSSTYGVLKLDRDDPGEEEEWDVVKWRVPPLLLAAGFPKKSTDEEPEPEIINAWELMEDLQDDIPMYSPGKRLQTKPVAEMRNSEGITESPRSKPRKSFSGKENLFRPVTARSSADPARVFKTLCTPDNRQRSTPVAFVQIKSSVPVNLKIQASCRRPLSAEPMIKGFSSGNVFDPDLLASIEKEFSEEEQIKKMVSSSAPRSRKAAADDAAAAALLESFEEICPPGGENAAVLYTTTLRGIRRTFEDCNAVREAVEAHGVQVTERDVSMDYGYRGELKLLITGAKERNGRPRPLRVPVLFVKGRLVGGAVEVLKLEDEGKLRKMLAGMPRASAACDGCGGVRFVLCSECSGSCKVFDEKERKTAKCGECNENGLIRCPICCRPAPLPPPAAIIGKDGGGGR